MEKNLKKILKKMIPILKKNDRYHEISYQIDLLYWLLNKLENGTPIKNIDFFDLIKNLYLSRGGLQEFFVWDKDYKTRVALNQEISSLKQELYNIITTIAMDENL